MAKIEDCPGFETFGEDVRTAREALGLTIKVLAEQINVAISTLNFSGRSAPSVSVSTTSCSYARKSICPSSRLPLTEQSN